METRLMGDEEHIKNLDLKEVADQKYTLVFTTNELDELEDLKIDLRRTFDLRTTKQELVRCALHELFDDYKAHGQTSQAVQRLRKRVPK